MDQLLGSPSTVIWLTAETTPPATVRYPAKLKITAGKLIGAVKIAPPVAAQISPMARNFRKSLGVGALILSFKVITNKFK
jgi:hypothetical protein